MEPLNIATLRAFAEITSLVSDFVAHRKGREGATEREFLDYLEAGKHDEVIQLLKTSAGIAAGTKALLKETHDDLSAQISALAQSFAELASTTRAFAPLASAIMPGTALSDQAVSILRTMSASGASNFILVHRGLDGGKDLVMDARADFNVTEQRFLDSDLDDLVRLRLLRLTYGKKGSPLYYYTRRAEALVQSLG